MNRVLEADASIPVARSVVPREHIKRDLCVTTECFSNILFQRVENPVQNRADNGSDSGYLVRDGVQLMLFTDLHTGTLGAPGVQRGCFGGACLSYA
jgi:hypothetical protein